jgi:hypothetical protein
MKIYFSIFCFSLIGFFSPTVHETYISISEIKILKEGKIELSLEIVAHDFEYVYQKDNSKELQSVFKEELEFYDNDLLKEYIFKHYSILNKSNKIDLKIIGNEINLDGILIIYIEANCKKNIKELTVFNDLLVNWFPNQQNIVNLNGELKSSFTFNKNIKSHVFQ